MSNLPKGFDKPRRQWRNWKWVAFPALVLLIFGYIMLKVFIAGERVAEERDERAYTDYMAKRHQYELQRLEDERRRAPAPPNPDEDEAQNMGNGIISHDFAGVSLEYPATMRGLTEPTGRGRLLVLRGESTIQLTVSHDGAPPEVVLLEAKPVQRTIAGEIRTGRRGQTELGRGITEVYRFALGAFTITLLYQPFGDEDKAEAELGMVAQSLRL